ncbi:MAG: hypothetical protein JWM86_735 [Thermoleophilia bacterium]|nr:hypothetical protein [Thermoleophilia bacterium]
MTLARTHIPVRMLRLAALMAIAVLWCVPSAMAAAADDAEGFGISPMRIDVETPPGQSSSHPITITNTDDVAVTYTFSKEDFQGDKDEPAATPVLLGGEFRSDISGYDWLTAPDSVTIPAGQTRTVTAKLSTPAGSTGGHYVALIVSGASREAGEIVAQSRAAVLFLMNAGGAPPPDIVITEITEVGPTRTVTEYINKGTTHTKPKPTITVTDPWTGTTITKVVGECTTALPGGSGQCIVDETEGTTVGNGGSTSGGGGLKSGLQKKSLDLLGEDENTSAHGELPTEWAGSWTSMLLPLVGIALFIMYFLFLRRRRKDGEVTEDDDAAAFGASY